MTNRFQLSVAWLGACLIVPLAVASVVVWDVDPAASYIRLTVPDQTLTIPDYGDATLRVRDASDRNQWTDAGGRRAAIDGEVVTEYADATSIQFLGGAHSLYARDQTQLRPNPAQWDEAGTNYTDTSTAPAALGGRIRATYLLPTFDVAFMAFRSVQLDITNVIGGAVAITGGAFAPNTTACGIAAGSLDVDGLELTLGLGQPVPDVRGGRLPAMVVTNAAGGTILNLGGLKRKLTYTISIPNLSIDMEGVAIAASAAGQIVAYALLPDEPITSPTLEAEKQGGDIVISWPADAIGFALQCATNLPPLGWKPVATPPAIDHGCYVVTNATVYQVVFYRLHRSE